MLQEIFAKKTYKCKQVRSDQIPDVIFLKHCIITYISRWNEIILKMYIEMKLSPKVQFKRL